jgi:transcriptional regulator with XRE-family HTH domain/Zn-dependent peptidase ImmA (M78 family)
MENLTPLLADPQALGQRLRQARELRRLTQQAVANRMRMVRTTLVNIEKGLRRVSESELRAFLELYEVTPESFSSDPNPDLSFAVAFRSFDGTDETSSSEESAELLAAAAELTQIARDFLSLENRSGLRMPRPEIPRYQFTPGVPSVHIAEEIATAERTRLGLGDGPLSDPRGVLESEVGVRVCLLPMPASVSGGFAAGDRLGDWIAVNAGLSPEARNQSLGYSLGHLLQTRYTVQAEQGLPADPDDRFLRAFAAAFLMPADGLSRRFNRLLRAASGQMTVGLVCGLADLYRLPVRMVVERLEAIHRLRAGTWNAVKKEIVSVTTVSPATPELPRQFVFLVVNAYLRSLIKAGNLTELLRLDLPNALEVVARFSNHPVDGGPDRLQLDWRQVLDTR